MVTRTELRTDTPRREAEVAARLTAAFATVTAAAAIWPLAGWPVSLALLLIGVLAGVAAHRAGAVVADGAVAPYILTVVCTLLADTVRYQVDYGPLLGDAVGGPLAQLDQRWWFVGFVVAPVTVMLFGGYVLGRSLPGAAIAAWWTVLFSVVDGLTCLVVLVSHAPSTPWLTVGVAAATTAQLVFATVLAQRLRPLDRGQVTRAPGRLDPARAQSVDGAHRRRRRGLRAGAVAAGRTPAGRGHRRLDDGRPDRLAEDDRPEARRPAVPRSAVPADARAVLLPRRGGGDHVLQPGDRRHQRDAVGGRAGDDPDRSRRTGGVGVRGLEPLAPSAVRQFRVLVPDRRHDPRRADPPRRLPGHAHGRERGRLRLLLRHVHRAVPDDPGDPRDPRLRRTRRNAAEERVVA